MAARIEVTHVGSLPRGDELTALLLAKDHGKPYDAAEFDRVVQAAVDDAVKKQVAAGVTIVSDGELGKVGYSTYITERLTGFGGHIERKPPLDMAAHPALAKKLAAIMGRQEFIRAACVGPVKLRTLEPARDDIRRFRAALDRHGQGVRAFMNAASPGLVTAFQPNKYYADARGLSRRPRRCDARRIRGDRRGGLRPAARLPRPRDGAAHRLPGSERGRASCSAVEANVEALNTRYANIPADRMRLHICWGNYEGPHDHDIPLEKVAPIRAQGAARDDPVRGGQSASRA